MRFWSGFLLAGLLTMVSPVGVAAVDGWPSYNKQSDTGLYVWRTWNGQWQMRALAGDGTRRVTGAFETAQHVSAANPVFLESNDLMRVVTVDRVDFDMRTQQGTVDGLRFSAGRGHVCLRVDSNVPIFLGANSEPATAPVDLTSSGACESDPPRAPGGDVLRTSKFDWELHLAPENEPAAFDGVFEFSQPLESFARESLEGADQAVQPAPNRLRTHLEAWPGGRDTVRFTIAEFTKVCLRSGTGSPQTVWLSSTGQAQPFQLTTPVDLTNDGACGVPADRFPPPTFGRKFNPGHYVALTGLDDHATMAESAVQGVRGFAKAYDWRQLEPTWGNYDFSAIEADLEAAAALGTQFVAVITDKSFSGDIPTPPYLRDLTVANRPGGYTAVRWHPRVVRRFKALFAALGRRFDNHPNFEGVATSESAPGFDGAALEATDYTPEKYRDALIEVLTGASQSFPRSRVFWSMNFMPGAVWYTAEVARSVAPLGVVMGGPDVLPDSFALQIQAYPFYDGAVGRMPLFNQVEQACYHHLHADTSFPTRFWTPLELFEFARDDLHLSYLFWVRWRWRQHHDSYNWWDAIPVIENHPTFNRN